MERFASLLGFKATEIPVAHRLKRFLSALLTAFGFVSFYQRFNESVGQITFGDHGGSLQAARGSVSEVALELM